MLRQILLMVFLIGLLASCKSSDATTKAAQPRYHKGYYKKSIYFKHYRVGRVHIKLFEKQGTKTVRKK